MTSMHIRDARPGDKKTILDVTLSAYEQYSTVMVHLWQIYRKNILSTLDDITPAEQIVAEQDGRIAGTVLLYPAGTEMLDPNEEPITLKWPEVRLLAVAPSARGQGVGAALMRECIARARKAGCSALILHTTDMMSVAIQMYERVGFQRDLELDFQPFPDLTIKGYRFDLEKASA